MVNRATQLHTQNRIKDKSRKQKCVDDNSKKKSTNNKKHKERNGQKKKTNNTVRARRI